MVRPSPLPLPGRSALLPLVLLAGCGLTRTYTKEPLPPVAPSTSLVAVDSKGNTIIAGTFHDEMRIGSEQARSSGGADAYVASVAANGKAWLKSFGGESDQEIMAVTVDGEDNIIVTGVFHKSANIGSKTLQATEKVPLTRGVFVAKLDPGGNIVWSQLVAVIAGATSVSSGVTKDGRISVGASVIGPVQVGGRVMEPKGSQSLLLSDLEGKSGEVIVAEGSLPSLKPQACVLPGSSLPNFPSTTCAHDICVTGVPLNPSCHWCVNLIVNMAHDTYCQFVQWDGLCKWEVTSVCGLPCL